MLWGRSGGRCSFPECPVRLVMDATETDDLSIVGDEAHIVAREPDGPRGVSSLTPEARDKYDNLILLCKIHHKLVDDQPGEYTVERLQHFKAHHEEHVATIASYDPRKQADDEVYSSYVDRWAELAAIENWKGWTSEILSAGCLGLEKDHRKSLDQMGPYLLSRVWPGRYVDLENALNNFRFVLSDFLFVFGKYSRPHAGGEWFKSDPIDKSVWYEDAQYARMLRKADYHEDLVGDLVFELTRAANLVCDRVRQCLIPSFRISEGVLLLQMGPFSDFQWRTYRAEYAPGQRDGTPYHGLRKFMTERTQYNPHWGKEESEDYFSELL